jgi:hypothetical protein
MLALLVIATPALTQAADLVSTKYDAQNNAITLTGSDGSSKTCALTERLREITPKLNWNHQVVLLTDTAFVSVSDVTACSGGKVAPSSIPKDVGFVVDVNLQERLYLALDAVSAGPISYAATVAKLGSSRPIGHFPGEYGRAKSMSELQREGFGYSETNPGRISSDGRYVSADGSMECAIYSHPGVWDLQTGKQIVKNEGCQGLFDATMPSPHTTGNSSAGTK